MTEVRTNKQVEISEIDGRLQEHYQARLQSALQELRDHYESQMKQNRDEVEVLYQNKVIRCVYIFHVLVCNVGFEIRFKIWKMLLLNNAALGIPITRSFFKPELVSTTSIPNYRSWNPPITAWRYSMPCYKCLSSFAKSVSELSSTGSSNWKRVWIRSATLTPEPWLIAREKSIVFANKWQSNFKSTRTWWIFVLLLTWKLRLIVNSWKQKNRGKWSSVLLNGAIGLEKVSPLTDWTWHQRWLRQLKAVVLIPPPAALLPVP